MPHCLSSILKGHRVIFRLFRGKEKAGTPLILRPFSPHDAKYNKQASIGDFIGGVPVTVTVYIDTLFVLNGFINYLLLLAAARIVDRPFRRFRLILGAALGGLYAVVVFLPTFHLFTSLLGKSLFALLMSLVAVGGRPWPRFWRYVLVFAGVSFALGGCVLALGYVTGQGLMKNGIPVLSIQMPTLLIGTILCYLLLTLVFRRMARHGGTARDIVMVNIVWASREVNLSALCDTGNTLSDPLSGTPVMVVECDSIRSILPAEAAILIDRQALRRPEHVLTSLHEMGLAGRFRLIPYHAVGIECGFLLAFRPDLVKVGQRVQKHILVALSPTHVSDGAAYSAVVGI